MGEILNCSKKLCAAALLLALIVAGAGAQTQSESISESTEIQSPASPSVDESALLLNPAGAAEAGRQSSAPSGIWLFVRMVFVLAVVVVCIYAVIRLMRHSMKTGDDSGPFLRKISSVSVAPGKSVQIVTLLDRAYLIGVSDAAVSLIGEVTDKELVDSMNLYADREQNAKRPRSFADILEIFMPGGPRAKGSVFEDSVRRTSDLLEKQRSRLRDGE